jgi:hypothetical protein
MRSYELDLPWLRLGISGGLFRTQPRESLAIRLNLQVKQKATGFANIFTV